VWIVRAVSLALSLNALGMVPYMLLTKDIDFRRRSAAETLGALVSSGVTVAAAYLGYGTSALVVGYLVRAVVRNATLWAVARWSPGLTLSFSGMSAVLRFGFHVTGSAMVRSFWQAMIRAIVGRMLEAGALGFYTVAETMSTGPHRISSAVIHQLSLPVFSKLQRDDERLRRYFLRITKYLTVAMLPAQVGMALVARDLVGVVLSERWLPMVGLFQALCVAGFFYILPLPASALLVARGRASRLHRYNWMFLIAMAIAVWIGAQFGLTGVGVAWLVAFPALRLWLLALGLREIRLSTKEYLGTIGAQFAAVAIMAIPVLWLERMAPVYGGAAGRLTLSVAVGAVTYVAALLAIDRRLGTEVRGVVQELLAPSRA
jgi:O-antigen/teichoic acid export membrane protein